MLEKRTGKSWDIAPQTQKVTYTTNRTGSPRGQQCALEGGGDDVQAALVLLHQGGDGIARVVQPPSCLDIISAALQSTLLATGRLYTFFDDAGALSLREAGGQAVGPHRALHNPVQGINQIQRLHPQLPHLEVHGVGVMFMA